MGPIELDSIVSTCLSPKILWTLQVILSIQLLPTMRGIPKRTQNNSITIFQPRLFYFVIPTLIKAENGLQGLGITIQWFQLFFVCFCGLCDMLENFSCIKKSFLLLAFNSYSIYIKNTPFLGRKKDRSIPPYFFKMILEMRQFYQISKIFV